MASYNSSQHPIPTNGINAVSRSINTLTILTYFCLDFFIILVTKSFKILAISGLTKSQNVVMKKLKISFIIFTNVFDIFLIIVFILNDVFMAPVLNIFHNTTNGKKIFGENIEANNAFGNPNKVLKSKFAAN